MEISGKGATRRDESDQSEKETSVLATTLRCKKTVANYKDEKNALIAESQLQLNYLKLLNVMILTKILRRMLLR